MENHYHETETGFSKIPVFVLIAFEYRHYLYKTTVTLAFPLQPALHPHLDNDACQKGLGSVCSFETNFIHANQSCFVFSP